MLVSVVLSSLVFASLGQTASHSRIMRRSGAARLPAHAFSKRQEAVTLNLPAGVDLGDCTDPTLRFAEGLEGRTETTFVPNNTEEFNHGAAQNHNIITEFICDTFVNECGANQAAQDLCAEAEAAVADQEFVGATADDFNAFFGAETNFASIQAVNAQGELVGDVVSADADSDADVSASADAAAATVTQVVDCSSGAAEATTTASSASGENLQTFTGDLGGLPPAVTEGGRGFAVEGNDDFLNLDAALSRSCAVHKNQCADEANSGGDFDVAECDAQESDCLAEI